MRISSSVLICTSIVALLVSAVGCQTTGLRSDSIPASLLAKPNVNMAAVDIPSMGVNNVQGDMVYLGDVVECTVLTGASAEPEIWESRVSSDGTIDVPFVGRVQIANQQVALAEQLLREASIERQVFRDPKVTLRIKERQTRTIQVTGAVAKPGAIELAAAGCNLVAALNAAGGVIEDAGETAEIYDPLASSLVGQSQQVHLPTASQTGSGNRQLNDGAVIHVPFREKAYVHVLGNANQNRSIEMKPDREMRLLDAISAVGGLRYSNWICDKVVVTRESPDSPEKVIIKLSAKEARKNAMENILLAPGDVIHIEENPVTFTLNTIKGLTGVGAQAATGMAQIR